MARHFSAQSRTFIWHDAAQRGGRCDTSPSQGWFSGYRSGGSKIPQSRSDSAVFLTNHLGNFSEEFQGITLSLSYCCDSPKYELTQLLPMIKHN